MLFAIVLAVTIGCIAFVLARERQGGPRPDGLRGRIRARGWGLLLLPVATAAAVMAGGAHGLIPAELGITVLAIVFAPKLAARRGIYPPVLADRGLADAIRALALDAPLPVELDIDLPGEVELPVASAVYFSVAEALTNAAKHARARSVRIQLGHTLLAGGGGMLRAQVTDDGWGGADPAQGTGLAGVERRLAAFDGILAVNSPPGGPTIVVIEVPCALSSPKTSSC